MLHRSISQGAKYYSQAFSLFDFQLKQIFCQPLQHKYSLTEFVFVRLKNV